MGSITRNSSGAICGEIKKGIFSLDNLPYGWLPASGSKLLRAYDSAEFPKLHALLAPLRAAVERVLYVLEDTMYDNFTAYDKVRFRGACMTLGALYVDDFDEINWGGVDFPAAAFRAYFLNSNPLNCVPNFGAVRLGKGDGSGLTYTLNDSQTQDIFNAALGFYFPRSAVYSSAQIGASVGYATSNTAENAFVPALSKTGVNIDLAGRYFSGSGVKNANVSTIIYAI